MLVVVARHVADAGFLRQLAELFALAVVENVDVELVRGPVDVQRGKGGVANDAERLVVGRNYQVYMRPAIRIIG